jgi:hypothetical protein
LRDAPLQAIGDDRAPPAGNGAVGGGGGDQVFIERHRGFLVRHCRALRSIAGSKRFGERGRALGRPLPVARPFCSGTGYRPRTSGRCVRSRAGRRWHGDGCASAVAAGAGGGTSTAHEPGPRIADDDGLGRIAGCASSAASTHSGEMLRPIGGDQQVLAPSGEVQVAFARH